jgi:hypothetical protein
MRPGRVAGLVTQETWTGLGHHHSALREPRHDQGGQLAGPVFADLQVDDRLESVAHA